MLPKEVDRSPLPTRIFILKASEFLCGCQRTIKDWLYFNNYIVQGGVADYVQIESAVKRRNKKSNCSG
jgi:hypothetical protein